MTARFRRVAGVRAGTVSFLGSARLASAALVFLLGCGGDGAGTQSIESSRTVARAGVDLSVPSDNAKRFGLAQHSTAQAPVAATASDPGLHFTTPAGWSALPATSMRLANFRVGGDARAECYLTLLGGDAGGAPSNINRWRTQMSLAAATASEIDALPTATLLGQEAKLVDLRGTFTGMSGTAKSSGWRLIGLVLVEPGGSAFLKMTGPDDVLEAQRDAFLELARSITVENEIDPETGNLATALAATRNGSDPHARGARAATDTRTVNPHAAASGAGATAPSTGGAGSAASDGGFAWNAPAGWRRAPDKTARLVTYFTGEGEALECYVTVLPGDAGGTLANVNRWRNQLGRQPIDADDLARETKVTLLGHDATLVDIEAASNGDKAGTRTLAIAHNAPQRSVFVKLTGPDALVAAQRAAFLAFAGSLVEAR